MLSHVVPEFNLICWNCKGCIGKSTGPIQFHHSLVAGSVPRSWLNASLLAQRLVAGSAPRSWLNFFERKKKGKKRNVEKLSQLHALEPARYAVIIPANTYYVFVF